jgi:ATP-dependent Clp protease adaptor protein ClpS
VFQVTASKGTMVSCVFFVSTFHPYSLNWQPRNAPLLRRETLTRRPTPVVVQRRANGAALPIRTEWSGWTRPESGVRRMPTNMPRGRSRKPSFSPTGGGATTLEREAVREKTTATKGVDPGKKYKLLLFNDEKNTRERVVEVLLKCIPGLSKLDAQSIMQKAHTTGMALVGVWVFELAEAYCDLLRSEGLVSDIEPAE